jgi:hypothetical protein
MFPSFCQLNYTTQNPSQNPLLLILVTSPSIFHFIFANRLFYHLLSPSAFKAMICQTKFLQSGASSMSPVVEDQQDLEHFSKCW